MFGNQLEKPDKSEFGFKQIFVIFLSQKILGFDFLL